LFVFLNIFSIRASENCLPKPHISIIKDKIETAIFGNKYDEVLIATESGSIKVSKYIKIIRNMVIYWQKILSFQKIVFFSNYNYCNMLD